MKLFGLIYQNRRTVLRALLLTLMLATVIFIFVNSMLPPEVSSEQSNAVGDFIATVIPTDTDLGKFIVDNLRKIAHFTEYGLLGIEIAIYISAFCEASRLRRALSSLPVPFIVGFTDETIQSFSGRGPAISDVWIDIGGFVFFSLIAYGVILLAGVLVRLVRGRLSGNRVDSDTEAGNG